MLRLWKAGHRLQPQRGRLDRVVASQRTRRSKLLRWLSSLHLLRNFAKRRQDLRYYYFSRTVLNAHFAISVNKLYMPQQCS